MINYSAMLHTQLENITPDTTAFGKHFDAYGFTRIERFRTHLHTKLHFKVACIDFAYISICIYNWNGYGGSNTRCGSDTSKGCKSIRHSSTVFA